MSFKEQTVFPSTTSIQKQVSAINVFDIQGGASPIWK